MCVVTALVDAGVALDSAVTTEPAALMPLHVAVMNNQTDVVRNLLTLGARFTRNVYLYPLPSAVVLILFLTAQREYKM